MEGYGSVCVGYGGVEWYKGGKMGKSEKGGEGERQGNERLRRRKIPGIEEKGND